MLISVYVCSITISDHFEMMLVPVCVCIVVALHYVLCMAEN